jgi:plasmid stabilization system protein ParE
LARKVVTSEPAAEDLQEARKWLNQPGSGSKARSRFTQIREAIKELRQAPCTWSAERHPPFRERVVSDYRIIYQVLPDTGDNRTAGDVVVLRVLGPGQNWRLVRQRP